jgi:hypothetical protein
MKIKISESMYVTCLFTVLPVELLLIINLFSGNISLMQFNLLTGVTLLCGISFAAFFDFCD